MVRTCNPKKTKRLRTHGYRAQSDSVRKDRMRKGRKLLSVRRTDLK